MSGSNQHTIPQIMLRGFGRKAKAKAIQVVVYRRDKVFTTGTRSIGAERFFYSNLGIGGETTLDDKITTYEQQLDGYIDSLRASVGTTELDAENAAKTVTHLTVRTAQLRNSFAQGATQMAQGVATEFLDPAKRWKLLGYHLAKPSGEVKKTIERAYIEGGFRARGIPRKAFFEFMFNGMKENFQKQSQVEALKTAVTTMVGMVPEGIAQGHRQTLSRSLAPEKRVEALRKLRWQILEFPFDLILPDCVAIEGGSASSCRPLVFAPNEAIGQVFMPITSRRALVGQANESPIIPEALNVMLAKCSWEYFVAEERTSTFERLTIEIGSTITSFMGAKVEEGLEAAFKTN